MRSGALILPDVAVVESVTALGAESRRILGIFGFPTTLVTTVQRRSCGLLSTALRAELALINSATSAGPAFYGSGSATLSAELAGSVLSAASTGPTVSRGSGSCRSGGRSSLLLSLLLLTHLEEGIGIHSAGSLSHIHAHKAHHSAVFVGSSSLHCLGLSLNHVGSSHIGIAEYC